MYPMQRNPWGEAYLASLLLCIERHQEDLLSGKMPLKLQPRALEYLAARVAALNQLQAIKASRPVEYLQARVADLADYQQMERLAQLLSKVRRLRLEAARPPLRDPTRCVLSPLSALTCLEFWHSDLSTSVWQGLNAVQGGLRRCVAVNSLEALHHLLAPGCSLDEEEASQLPPCWPTLTSLAASHNSFADMDASLHLLPKLASLDLSHNNIARVSNLQHCTSLTSLDLSCNRLRCVAAVADAARTLRTLCLASNALSCCDGVEALVCLESLDLRDNLLANFMDLEEVCKLPRLSALRLVGNPVACLPSYRLAVLSLIPSPGGVLLDDARPGRSELATLARGGGAVYRACLLEDVLQEHDHLWQVPLDKLRNVPHLTVAALRGGSALNLRGAAQLPPRDASLAPLSSLSPSSHRSARTEGRSWGNSAGAASGSAQSAGDTPHSPHNGVGGAEAYGGTPLVSRFNEGHATPLWDSADSRATARRLSGARGSARWGRELPPPPLYSALALRRGMMSLRGRLAAPLLGCSSPEDVTDDDGETSSSDGEASLASSVASRTAVTT